MNFMIKNFVLGSDFIYLKLYTGPFFADNILRKICDEVISLYDEKKISMFFFIRYLDPDYHIRFRIKLSNFDNTLYVIRKINFRLQQEIEAGVVKIVYDTYCREIERYGLKNIESIEHLFYYDSLSYIKFIEKYYESENFNININYYKLGYIFHNILRIIKDFGIQREAEYKLVKKIVEAYEIEFNKDSALNKALQKKFKKEISNIKNLSTSSIVANILTEKSVLSKSHIEYLLSINNDTEIDRLVCNYIHLCCNRTFDYDFRKCEYIVYDLLYRFLKEELFRNNR